MTLFVAVDDTDARDGMCTTWLAAAIEAAFRDREQTRLPRLVRLNPNAPWKTRGNAAITQAFMGDADLDESLARLRAVVKEHARFDADGTEPGYAVTATPPHRAFYERTVQEIVTRDDAVAALEAVGARYEGGRGVIGAAAALSWTPRDVTFEAIAYREPARWGTPRDVDAASVAALSERFPSTFDSFDHANDEVVMVPRSPCPVLFGVRGDDPFEASAAVQAVTSEPVQRVTVFASNQATDEHVQRAALADARELTTVAVEGTVAARPRFMNGHAFVTLQDGDATLRAAAYAPTAAFRDVVLGLREGDRVVAVGGVKRGPDGALTVGLEKLRVVTVARDRVKKANPMCSACRKRMKSRGRGAGYQCARCGKTAATPEMRDAERVVATGWHEVPARARRHLAKPLQRGLPAWAAVDDRAR